MQVQAGGVGDRGTRGGVCDADPKLPRARTARQGENPRAKITGSRVLKMREELPVRRWQRSEVYREACVQNRAARRRISSQHQRIHVLGIRHTQVHASRNHTYLSSHATVRRPRAATHGHERAVGLVERFLQNERGV